MASKDANYSEIYKRISSLCKEKGTSATALCLELTGSKGNLATWQKGNISSTVLDKIVQRLDTSADYILTGEKPHLTNDLVELQSLFDSLPDDLKSEVIECMTEMRDDPQFKQIISNMLEMKKKQKTPTSVGDV